MLHLFILNLELLELGRWAYLMECKAQKIEPDEYADWAVDLSQNPKRRYWGNGLKWLGQRSQPFVYACDRLMTAEDGRSEIFRMFTLAAAQGAQVLVLLSRRR